MFSQRFHTILSWFMGSLLAFSALLPGMASAAAPTYSIAVTSTVVTGFTLDIAGTANSTKFAGQLDDYHVLVNWGDGSPVTLDTTHSFTESGNDFSGTWSGSHVYAPGTYTITVKLYHGQPPGNEASGDAVVTIGPITIPPGQLTVIKHVVNTNTGTNIAGDFTMNVTASNPTLASFPGSETGTVIGLDAGSYSVTEASTLGYSQSLSAGCSGTIASGESKVCTITNSDVPLQPTLTVTKVVVNADNGTAQVSDFPLFVGATQVTSGAANTFAAGTYTVSETGSAGYTATFSGDCDANGSVTLADNDVKSCTITNTERPTTITVNKVVVNDNGGTVASSTVALFVDGNSVTGGTPTPVTPGAHVVTETNPTGYTAAFSGACDAQGNITAVFGQNVTCTITNNDQPAQLTVIKNVTNDNGGLLLPSAFAIHVDGTDVSDADFNGSSAGVTVTLDAGSYQVTETPVTGYQASMENCSGSLALGEQKTCTITNDDQPAQLTVIKHVINDDGTRDNVAGDFTMVVTGTDVSNPSFAGSESGTVVTLDAGTFSVNETDTLGYTRTFSANCNGTLALGASVTCTITNDDPEVVPPPEAWLTLIKHVVNDNGGTLDAPAFSLLLSQGSTTITSVPGSETGVTVEDLAPGSYTVGEAQAAGYVLTYSGDCATDGTITLADGDTKTCTITNDDATSTLTVTKIVINDNNGTSTVSDFPLWVEAGETQTPVTSGETNTFNAGTYTVGETTDQGYVSSFPETWNEEANACDANGNVRLGLGENLHCFLVNDDPIPPTGTIRVIKVVTNDDTGEAQASDFTLSVTGNNPSTSTFPGSSEGTDVVVEVGEYLVTELNTTSNYAVSYSEECSGTIRTGETITCTVTNDDVETPVTYGTLIVKKHVINDSRGTFTANMFLMLVTGTNVSQSSFPGSEDGVTVTLDPGSYSVDEDASIGYAKSLGADCSGTIAAGETKTCIITNDDPTTGGGSSGGGGGGGGSSGGGGGGGGLPSTSGGGATGFAPPAPAGRVLGIEDVNTAEGACWADEPEANVVVQSLDEILAALGTDRNLPTETFFDQTLVPRVIPADLAAEFRDMVKNWTVYGTNNGLKLGAGERAGVVDSYRAVYGHVPRTACEWRDALRIATSRLPSLNESREQSMLTKFKTMYKRDADRSQAKDNAAVNIMTYGIRPVIRSLANERRAIPVFRRLFGHIPGNATEWDAMRAMANSGLALP